MHWKDVLAVLCLVVGVLSCVTIPEQADFLYIIACISIAFLGFGLLLLSDNISISLRQGIVLGLGIRCIMLFVFPNLSEDIYRFIWDGALWHHGVHPFAMTPNDFMAQHAGQTPFAELISLMNSPDYYSIYPPVCQAVFFIISWFEGLDHYWMSVILKSLMLISELVSLYFLIRILRFFKQSEYYALAYFLNPLILIELIGNVHFEVFMICFMVLMIYMLCLEAYFRAGLFFALAISVKLLPLMFVPLLFFYLLRKQDGFWKFALSSVLLLAVLFIPMFQDHYLNIWQSIDLYFQRFEFNASIYYLGRAIGYWFKGYNIIGFLGPMLSIIAMLSIIYLAIRSYVKRVNLSALVSLFNVSFLLYLGFATTVHPWYLAIPILLNVFTRFRFIWLWSMLVFLSYSAYMTEPVEEISWLISFEYLLVFFVVILERKKIIQTLGLN